MANEQVVILILDQVSHMIVYLIPVIAITAVLKMVFDIIFDFLYGITGRSR